MQAVALSQSITQLFERLAHSKPLLRTEQSLQRIVRLHPGVPVLHEFVSDTNHVAANVTVFQVCWQSLVCRF
jgi:hypothetical protein